MKIIQLLNHLLNTIFIVFFVLSLSFAGYAIYDVYIVYEDSELSSDILKYKPSIQGENEFGEKFSVLDLKKINQDIVGWIRVFGTNIDYPILAGKTNSSYIDKNYKNEYSAGGSIFLDYRNSAKFEDDFSVIYGHNMSYGKMFSDIKKYKSKSFFNEHNKGVLYTEDEVYDLDIYSFNVIDSNHDIGYKLNTYSNDHNRELAEHFLNEASQKREMIIEDNDKYLLLSTCFGVGTYDRSVLLGKLIKNDSDTVINGVTRKKYNLTEQRTLKKIQSKSIFDKIFVFLILIVVVGIIYVKVSIIIKERVNKKK